MGLFFEYECPSLSAPVLHTDVRLNAERRLGTFKISIGLSDDKGALNRKESTFTFLFDSELPDAGNLAVTKSSSTRRLNCCVRRSCAAVCNETTKLLRDLAGVRLISINIWSTRSSEFIPASFFFSCRVT